MRSLLLLLGLLVLSYFAGALRGSVGRRAIGSRSGTEFLFLGLAVGPAGLRLVDADLLVPFEPFLLTALGWFALTCGVRFCARGFAPGAALRLGVGLLASVVVAAMTFGVATAAVSEWLELSPRDAFALALGMAAIGADSARTSVCGEPSRRQYAELSRGVDTVTSALVLALFTASAGADAMLLDPAMRGVASVAFGAVLGGIAVLLFLWARESYQRWATLLGLVLLCVGVSLQMGFSLLATGFLLGSTFAAFCRRAQDAHQLLRSAERPLFAPVLLLAGASLSLDVFLYAGGIVVLVVATRMAGKWLVGALITRLGVVEPNAGRWLGCELSTPSLMTMAVGLVVFHRHPGLEGHLVLAVAVLTTGLGPVFDGWVRRGSRRTGRAAVAEDLS